MLLRSTSTCLQLEQLHAKTLLPRGGTSEQFWKKAGKDGENQHTEGAMWKAIVNHTERHRLLLTTEESHPLLLLIFRGKNSTNKGDGDLMHAQSGDHGCSWSGVQSAHLLSSAGLLYELKGIPFVLRGVLRSSP